MNSISVKRFHDHTRQLHEMEINPEAVAAIGEPTILYGPNGSFTCRQVWLIGGNWFFVEDDGTLVERLKNPPQA